MRNKLILMVIVVTSILLTVVSMAEYRPVIIYNPSESAPIGFYFIDQQLIAEVGDYILVNLPYSVKELAVERRYVGPGIPLLKRIFSTYGDHVCSKDGQVFVNQEPITKVKTHDPSGRKLPTWNGCRALNKGEYFLLSLHSDYSFDSRYFGPIMQNQIIGVAIYF